MTVLWFILTFIAGMFAGAGVFHLSVKAYLNREELGPHDSGLLSSAKRSASK
jgi:hypothetical protein